MTAREEDLFLEFKRRPTQDALARLLLGYQDHIYNLCFQVLRHPEDAEDVSQQVLIETAGGVAKIGSPRQFKVWLYKVALHAALKLKETRARRVELARKLATTASTGGGDMDSEKRAALMRAIGDLDDATRCILFEHYFDKLTLEEIGAREGVSSVAIWKRLDRAKETLRRSLAGVAVAPLLEGISPVAAPAGFVAKAVIAGGIAVGTKSVLTAGGIIAALFLLGATAGGGYLVGGTIASKKSEPEVNAPPTATERIVDSAVPTSPPHAKPVEVAAEAAPEPDWNAVAQEAFGLAIDIRRGRIPFNRMQLLEAYGRLNEKTGPWFVKKCREALKTFNENERYPLYRSRAMEEYGEAMELASRSGGQAAAEYFLEVASASSRLEFENASLYLLLRDVHNIKSETRIIFSTAFLEPAKKLAGSADTRFERSAGYAILGRIDSPASREFLESAIQGETNAGPLAVAILALSRVGNASTLSLLRTKALTFPEGHVAAALTEAIARLEAKLGVSK